MTYINVASLYFTLSTFTKRITIHYVSVEKRFFKNLDVEDLGENGLSVKKTTANFYVH